LLLDNFLFVRDMDVCADIGIVHGGAEEMRFLVCFSLHVHQLLGPTPTVSLTRDTRAESKDMPDAMKYLRSGLVSLSHDLSKVAQPPTVVNGKDRQVFRG
jgi:hypothetical protein